MFIIMPADPYQPIEVTSVWSMVSAVRTARRLRDLGAYNDLLWAVRHLETVVEWLRHEAEHCPGPRRREGRRMLLPRLEMELRSIRNRDLPCKVGQADLLAALESVELSENEEQSWAALRDRLESD